MPFDDSPPPREEAVRLLVLACGDPDAERPFSGSLRSLVRALEDRGVVHHKANVLGYTDTFRTPDITLRTLYKLDRWRLIDAYRWSGACWGRNSARARRIAARHPGYNAVLMYGTSVNPRLPAPSYCYFDATAAQVRRHRAWDWKHLSDTRIDWVVGYQQRVFDGCAAIFPRSQWAADSVHGDYGIPWDRITVAGAGPNYLADPLPHGPYDSQTILFVGREFDRKGGPLILEAFRRLRARMPGARLRIVGCRPPVDAPGVEVLGPITQDAGGGRDRILQLYSEASVFCIMSRFEPFGIVVVEAQNSGVPCVVPNRFAFPEMVRHGETGCVLPEDDPEALAALFHDLLSDPDRLAGMGRAAQAHVRARYTWAAAAERIHQRIAADLGAPLRAAPAEASARD
jgi:glycosyltransferase involved in cell wall biosynthesis